MLKTYPEATLIFHLVDTPEGSFTVLHKFFKSLNLNAGVSGLTLYSDVYQPKGDLEKVYIPFNSSCHFDYWYLEYFKFDDNQLFFSFKLTFIFNKIAFQFITNKLIYMEILITVRKMNVQSSQKHELKKQVLFFWHWRSCWSIEWCDKCRNKLRKRWWFLNLLHIKYKTISNSRIFLTENSKAHRIEKLVYFFESFFGNLRIGEHLKERSMNQRFCFFWYLCSLCLMNGAVHFDRHVIRVNWRFFTVEGDDCGIWNSFSGINEERRFIGRACIDDLISSFNFRNIGCHINLLEVLVSEFLLLLKEIAIYFRELIFRFLY